MDTQGVLYFTDGHEVTVTDSVFKVRNSTYPMNGIVSHRVSIVLPYRMPFMALIVIGGIVFVCGVLDWLPSAINESTTVFGVTILDNVLAMVLGGAVSLLGIFAILYFKDKYVVWVSTSEGELTALISNKREYVNKIAEALDQAHLDLLKRQEAGG